MTSKPRICRPASSAMRSRMMSPSRLPRCLLRRGMSSDLQRPSVKGVRISRLGVEGVDVETLPDGVLLATPEEMELLRIERRPAQVGARTQ